METTKLQLINSKTIMFVSKLFPDNAVINTEDLISSIMLCINCHRQKEAVEKDVPYMKRNGAAETSK